MIQIKNLKTKKNDEFIERQWVHVNALRDRLIAATEWTQNSDNLLTLESNILWSEWRRKVYDVSEMNFDTPEDAENQINHLNDTKPISDMTSTEMRQKKYRLDIQTLDTARRDAKRIVRDYISSYLEELLPENIHIINLKHQSYIDWRASGLEDFKHFPLLEMHRAIHSLNIEECVDSILSLHRLATDEAAKLIVKEFEYTDKLNYAPTISEVIHIIKKMHGY